MSDHPPIPGDIHSEDLIEVEGEDVTVYDRDIVKAECARCDHRWEPTDADDTSCPDCGHDGVIFTTRHAEEYDFGDRTIRIYYEPVIKCEHCGNEWGTRSDADRPSCSACHRKTDRNRIGKRYEARLKNGLFTGDETEVDDVAAQFDYYTTKFKAMEANGWRLDQTTSNQNFILFSKGETTAGPITP